MSKSVEEQRILYDDMSVIEKQMWAVLMDFKNGLEKEHDTDYFEHRGIVFTKAIQSLLDIVSKEVIGVRAGTLVTTPLSATEIVEE